MSGYSAIFRSVSEDSEIAVSEFCFNRRGIGFIRCYISRSVVRRRYDRSCRRNLSSPRLFIAVDLQPPIRTY